MLITITEDTQFQQARLSVHDQGIGIPRQQQGHIFGRFVRADNARARDIPGTGLGLHLCRELIGRMGGQLWFESEENVGSTFFVTLPLAPSGAQNVGYTLKKLKAFNKKRFFLLAPEKKLA